MPQRRAGNLSGAVVVTLSMLGLPLWGCAPNTVVDYAQRHAMSVRQVEGRGFNHLLVERAGTVNSSRLHVYIEGDGIPWMGNFSNPDPTPRNTLALRLANLDSNDIAYVGRPCYFRVEQVEPCHPIHWTSDRYGEAVLQSMAAVIQRTRQPHHTEIILIGHSGGGTLAALLESRIEGVAAVITVAGNLDVEAWADFHNYDPLVGSLNPIAQPRPAGIVHLQLVGSRDETVPAVATRDYSRKQPNVQLRQYEAFGHVCCWEDVWPEILNEFFAGYDWSMRQSGE